MSLMLVVAGMVIVSRATGPKVAVVPSIEKSEYIGLSAELECLPDLLFDRAKYRDLLSLSIPRYGSNSAQFLDVNNERVLEGKVQFFRELRGPLTKAVFYVNAISASGQNLPSGHRIGWFFYGPLGLSRDETIAKSSWGDPSLWIRVIGPGEDVTIRGYGPRESAPVPTTRYTRSTWVEDPEWPLFLETLARESLAKAASRRLSVVGDLGRTEDGLGFVKLETAARFGGYAVKIEERGLKATLTKGGETRVIWAGEPMVQGETGDIVMLKDGALWVPEFWETAGTK